MLFDIRYFSETERKARTYNWLTVGGYITGIETEIQSKSRLANTGGDRKNWTSTEAFFSFFGEER